MQGNLIEIVGQMISSHRMRIAQPFWRHIFFKIRSERLQGRRWSGRHINRCILEIVKRISEVGIGSSSHKKTALESAVFSICYVQFSALTSFEPTLRLVDHVDAAFATHNPAITVPVLERAERVLDLHWSVSNLRRLHRGRGQRLG